MGEMIRSSSADETREILTNKEKFDQLWRWAQLSSSSQMVPAHYRGKPEDTFVATTTAMRLGVDPILYMQNTYFIQGKPAVEAKFAIALANGSGVFHGPIQYELEGTGDSMQARAYAIIDATGDVAEEVVTMQQAHAEGWTKKAGSKWKTLPGLMLKYRAATFLVKLHCPEVLMGLQTTQELTDISENAPRSLTERVSKANVAPVAEIVEEVEEVF